METLVGSQNVTDEVKKAFFHVKSQFDDLTYLMIDVEGRWMYLTDDFDAPKFEDVDIGILEDAVDSLREFPAIFQLIRD